VGIGYLDNIPPLGLKPASKLVYCKF